MSKQAEPDAMPGRRPRKHATRGYAPEATRRAVIDSALSLFERKGFHATSVQEIAERAKVSKGAFYHHFDSKEDVLRLIYTEFADVQLADTRRAIETFDSPTDQLREVVRANLVTTARYRANVNVFFQERRFLSAARFSEIKAQRDESEAQLVGIVERGIATGEFRADLDAKIAVFNVIGTIVWTNQWFRPNGPLTAEQVGDLLADFVIRGIAAPAPAKR
jgi:TetR/AcrR family transcriptional regulator, cholesterol catabolism regulator